MSRLFHARAALILLLSLPAMIVFAATPPAPGPDLPAAPPVQLGLSFHATDFKGIAFSGAFQAVHPFPDGLYVGGTILGTTNTGRNGLIGSRIEQFAGLAGGLVVGFDPLGSGRVASPFDLTVAVGSARSSFRNQSTSLGTFYIVQPTLHFTIRNRRYSYIALDLAARSWSIPERGESDLVFTIGSTIRIPIGGKPQPAAAPSTPPSYPGVIGTLVEEEVVEKPVPVPDTYVAGGILATQIQGHAAYGLALGLMKVSSEHRYNGFRMLVAREKHDGRVGSVLVLGGMLGLNTFPESQTTLRLDMFGGLTVRERSAGGGAERELLGPSPTMQISEHLEHRITRKSAISLDIGQRVTYLEGYPHDHPYFDFLFGVTLTTLAPFNW